ncbi:MAG TPA: 50S ribosomal protein L4 [Candidatus Nanoarchaeia archaeon]|nr:50S ribosomal protein L4 [Candidatus Nanoarchaeia archaeon]
MKVYTIEGREHGNIDTPIQFKEPYHPNLIKRAVLAAQLSSRQPYSAFKGAGKRASVKISKRRRDYRTSYGHGMSRTPRKVIWHRGRQFGWIGAFSPNTTKGRRAHPPKSEKVLEVKINKKENNKAIRSALSATLTSSIVASRNHILPANFPVCVESKFEAVSKTKQALAILKALGFEQELTKSSRKIIRPGKGKTRGRKYRKKSGPLIIVSSTCSLSKAAKNIPGIDIAVIDSLNPELLAPGTHPGRLTLYTDKAVARLSKEALYI